MSLLHAVRHVVAPRTLCWHKHPEVRKLPEEREIALQAFRFHGPHRPADEVDVLHPQPSNPPPPPPARPFVHYELVCCECGRTIGERGGALPSWFIEPRSQYSSLEALQAARERGELPTRPYAPPPPRPAPPPRTYDGREIPLPNARPMKGTRGVPPPAPSPPPPPRHESRADAELPPPRGDGGDGRRLGIPTAPPAFPAGPND